jgi:hypothetical protein
MGTRCEPNRWSRPVGSKRQIIRDETRTELAPRSNKSHWLSTSSVTHPRRVVEPAFCPSGIRIKTPSGPSRAASLFRNSVVRPDGLFGAGRASPLRGRPAGDQLGQRRPSCRTGLLSVGGSNLRPAYNPPRAAAVRIFCGLSAPGRIRTADHLVRSSQK